MLKIVVERRSIRGDTVEEVVAYRKADPDFIGDAGAAPGGTSPGAPTAGAVADVGGQPAYDEFAEEVAIIKAFFTRTPSCPPAIKRLAHRTLEAGAVGLTQAQAAEAMGVDVANTASQLGPLGKRVKGTPGGKAWVERTGNDPMLLLYRTATRADGWYYVPTKALLAALQALAADGYFDN